MFVFGGNSASTGYNLTRSLRTRASASAYLNRTPSTTGTGGSKTWTYSLWVKRGILGSRQVILDGYAASAGHELEFGSNDVIEFAAWGGAAALDLITTQVFRDPSAWYHIVLAVDTTQATAANRIKLYVNGAQVTSFSTATYPAQNALTYIGSNVLQEIGRRGDAQFYFDGYTTEVNFIDGQALTPSSFGSTNALTGVWQPARYTGTYGTNGFYLPFTDNSALTTSSNVGLGKDFSGNGNYWTTNNISITAGVTYDSMTDVPTLTSTTAANFATWNPLDFAGSPTFSNGNLYVSGASKTRSTIALPSGVKTYVEAYQTGTAASVDVFVGLLSSAAAFPSVHANPGVNWYATDTIYGQLNGSTSFSFAGTLAAGAILQIAYDGSTGKVWLGINNTWYTSAGATSGNPSAGTGEFATLSTSTSWSVYCGTTTGFQTITAKFGQNGQSYTPPTGFVALSTYNLPTSTILQGNKVMDATLYTGTGSNQNIVNAAGFKPDFVWGKLRNGADQNFLANSVAGATNYLVSNSTQQETADATTVVSLNSNGFTVGTSTNLNRSGGYNFVGWQWQAGQGSTSSNTNGTITSTVSVNASAGFSVVTWTGTGANATVGHGLGVAPQLIINKPRNAADNWVSWHTSLGSTGYIYLNLTNASTTLAAMWNSTLPTSSVFSVGTNSNINTSAQTMVSYCWTPIAGYSAFGSYSGNNSTDGPMVYTGFQPKFVLIKGTGNASGWQLQDSARNTYNVVNAVLRPDLSAAESTGYGGVLDFLSNGFKLRTTDTNYNSSSYGPYIYMAFATNPFKQSLGF